MGPITLINKKNAFLQLADLFPVKSKDLCFYFPVVPDIIIPAEDHASFAEAGAADLSQLSLTARTLQTARVPVPIHGKEQEAIRNPASATRTGAHRTAATSSYRHGGSFHTAVHHRLPAGKSGEAYKSEGPIVLLQLNFTNQIYITIMQRKFYCSITGQRYFPARMATVVVLVLILGEGTYMMDFLIT